MEVLTACERKTSFNFYVYYLCVLLWTWHKYILRSIFDSMDVIFKSLIINPLIREKVFLGQRSVGRVVLQELFIGNRHLPSLGLWVIEMSDGLRLPCHQEFVECHIDQLLAKLLLFLLSPKCVAHWNKWKLGCQLRSTSLIKQI